MPWQVSAICRLKSSASEWSGSAPYHRETFKTEEGEKMRGSQLSLQHAQLRRSVTPLPSMPFNLMRIGSQPCARITLVSRRYNAPLRACIGASKASRHCWLVMYSRPSQSTRPCSRPVGACHGSFSNDVELFGRRGGVRGFQRKTNKLPHPQVSKEFPGRIDTSTPYVIAKVVSRLEMDSRWALARSVRALVAERDALKERVEANSSRQPESAHVERRNF